MAQRTPSGHAESSSPSGHWQRWAGLVVKRGFWSRRNWAHTQALLLSAKPVFLDPVNVKCNGIARFLANRKLPRNAPKLPSSQASPEFYMHQERVLGICMRGINPRCWILHKQPWLIPGLLPAGGRGQGESVWQRLGSRPWDGDRRANSHFGDKMHPSIIALPPRHQAKHGVQPRLPF